MKSVLFLTHKNPQGYRIQQYFPYIEKRGFDVTLLTTDVSFVAILTAMRRADVVYIQRLLFDPLKLKLVRAAAQRIVYDFDDAVMFGTKGESPTRRNKFAAMVSRANAVFGGNKFLCTEAERYRKDGVFYVPTVVDPHEYLVKTPGGSEQGPVVGWIGSSSTLKYVEPLLESLLESGPVGDVLFKVVADRPPAITAPQVLFAPWTSDGEKILLAGFDVGIMPLDNDLWSQGKCGLKLIQYMASAVPPLASPVGVAHEIIEEGENGFFCGDIGDWSDKIARLAADPVLRRSMGQAARRTVEERYSLHHWGPRVAAIIDGLS